VTDFIRKYYNQPDALDHRRIWPQKENQKREQRVESQRQDQNLDQRQDQNQSVGRTETVEEVFGKASVTPSEMTKKIWKFIKSKKLSNR